MKRNINSYKRVLIFGAVYLDNIGGIQRSYQFLINYLINEGWEVGLAGWFLNNNREMAYPVHQDAEIFAIERKFTDEYVIEIERLIVKFNPTIGIIINSGSNSIFYASIFNKLNIPYIQSFRDSSEYCLKYLWTSKKVMDLVIEGSIGTHMLMPSYKKIFNDKIQSKITIIPSPIKEADNYAQVEKANNYNKYIVLYSGRFTFEKRIDLLIKAFYRLKDEFKNWDLWLYGSGPLEEDLLNLVKKLDMLDRVRFEKTSNTDEMYKVYKQVHLKVLPSEQEGCPMALREAMAHKIPVIGFQECSGTNEIIENGINGLLVSEVNGVENLYQAMKNLMSNPIKRKELGERAYVKSKEYTPDYINDRWEKFINQMLREFNNKPFFNLQLYDIYKKRRFQEIYIFKKNNILMNKFRKEYLVIYGHRLFDKRYYLEEYYDVKLKGIDPLLHYISEGWKQGYNPSAEFDNNLYIKYFKVEEDICPLFHYYAKGGLFLGYYPIHTNNNYYDKWPNRKPKNGYNYIEDLKQDFNILSSWET